MKVFYDATLSTYSGFIIVHSDEDIVDAYQSYCADDLYKTAEEAFVCAEKNKEDFENGFKVYKIIAEELDHELVKLSGEEVKR